MIETIIRHIGIAIAEVLTFSKILGSRRVACNKFRTEDPEMDATVNSFCRPGDMVIGICAPLS